MKKLTIKTAGMPDVWVYQTSDPNPGAASVEVPVQALFDRTEYLETLVGGPGAVLPEGTALQHLEHDGDDWVSVNDITFPTGANRFVGLEDVAAGSSYDLILKGQDSSAGGSTAGDLRLKCGDADTNGQVILETVAGSPVLTVKDDAGTGKLGLFSATPVAQQSVNWYASDSDTTRAVCQALKNLGAISGTEQTTVNPEVQGWRTLVPTTDYNTTASDGNTIAMNQDFRRVIRNNTPIRIWSPDTTKAWVNDANGILSAWGVTGLVRSHTDDWGILDLVSVSDGGGYYHLEFYDKPEGATGRTLLAHTATYNSTGSKAVVPDGGSGLGGTITVGAVTGGGANIGFYSYHIVTDAHSSKSSMDVAGPGLPTGGGALVEVQYGSQAAVKDVWIQCGSGAIPTISTSALLSGLSIARQIRFGSYAALVRIGVWLKTAASTYCRFNVEKAGSGEPILTDNGNEGLEVTTSESWVYSTTTVKASAAIFSDERLEIIKSNSSTSASNAGLNIHLQFIADDNSLWS